MLAVMRCADIRLPPHPTSNGGRDAPMAIHDEWLVGLGACSADPARRAASPRVGDWQDALAATVKCRSPMNMGFHFARLPPIMEPGMEAEQP